MKTITFCFTSERARELYNGKPPQYETPCASGFDLRAVEFDNTFDTLAIDGNIYKKPNVWRFHNGRRTLIKTGIRVAMPIMENQIMELQIRSRSGLALKYGICVLNGIGTIDNDFRGELGVILYNAGHEPFMINIGDRIAQGIFNPLQQCKWQEVSQEDFDKNFCNTQRGSGGFGSTGK